MTKKTKSPKGSSAYRIKRAKKKRPVRFLELAIVALLVVVVFYVASFTVQIARGYSEDSKPTEHYINLQILNGCGEKGIANKLADKIEMMAKPPLAVRVIDTDNFDNFGVEKSFIISRHENLTAANLMAEQLGLDKAVTYRAIDDNYLDIGATLVLGTDYQVLFENKSDD